jgi:ABC-type bacteriocin/lantibiotic exporter with double-glycine peptidase domain
VRALLRVLQYLRPYRLLACATLSSAIAATALDLVPPWLIKIVIDDVIQAHRPELLGWAVAGLIGAYALKNGFVSLRIRLNNTLEQRVVCDLRNQSLRPYNACRSVILRIVHPARSCRVSRTTPSTWSAFSWTGWKAC